ncbi:MAG: hypothetical protein KDB04_10235 [Acidimicrobiales bacterium]|nr:hypothetical protein [Acidimicrobiales bacterium]HRW39301.1 hypothetical protein [Aquihabitans sp.]
MAEGAVEHGLFHQVADAVAGMVDPGLGRLRATPRRWGLKAWFDDDECPREHYEAQVLGVRHVPEATVLAIEVGFHAEHPSEADNDDALAPLLAAAPALRRELGDDLVIGPFLGRASWRRASEVWIDPDLSDPELCFELADRLGAYLMAVEPRRR